ncbi:hypothetical protein ACFL59_00275 [Planctomycetota bacterium]
MEGEPVEIERVYLLDRLPDLPVDAVTLEIEQGYLPDREVSLAAGWGGPFLEGRIRRTVDSEGMVRRFHTIKEGAGLIRREVERQLTEEEFGDAWPLTAGRRIRKTRHRVREGDLTWEIDWFRDLDLVMAEVELPVAELQIVLPDWLAPHVLRDLTYEPRYRNYALATLGMPSDHPG